MPDLIAVILNGTVTGERSHIGDVPDAFFMPFSGAGEEVCHFSLRFHVRLKVSGNHVIIASETVQQRFKNTAVCCREEIIPDQFQSPLKIGIAALI